MKILKSFLPIILFLSIFSLFSSLVFAANPCKDHLFCLADAYNSTSGNVSVVVCAGNSTNINGLTFWYNGEGPLNSTNGGITFSNYSSTLNVIGAAYDNAQNVNNGSSPSSCLTFVLNQTFSKQPIPINATVSNLTNFEQAGSQGKAAMFTQNYVYIETRDAAGTNNLANSIVSPFNNITKEHQGTNPGITDTAGYWAEHCVGSVQGENCIPAGGPQMCMYHSDGLGADTCVISSNTSVYAMNVVYSNMSQQNVTPGQPMIINLSIPTAMVMVMGQVFSPGRDNSMSNLQVSSYYIYDYTTGEYVFNLTSSGGDGQGGQSGPPSLLQPFHLYKINFTYSGRVYEYPFMTPTNGPTGAQVYVANTTIFPADSGYRTVIGKVVNESKVAVPGAVVYGQFFKGPGGLFGISFFNSSVTDSNGIFTMRLPRTLLPGEPGNPGDNNYFPMYQFFIVSGNLSSSGVPLYFTTIDNNNDKGYMAIADTTVLSPLVLKVGGQVDVNVTLNNASVVMSELSKFVNLGTGVSRTAATGKFSMTSVFGGVLPPTSMLVSLLSPVGSVGDLVVNLFGKYSETGDPMSGSIVSACFNTSASVTQGVATSLTCNLTQVGFLNLTVFTCNDIFDVNLADDNKCPNIFDDSHRDKRAGSFDFWFNTQGILHNSTGHTVLYVNPEGVLLENIAGYGASTTNITIPLPPGDYSFELIKPSDWGDYLDVNNKTTFTIAAGQTMNMNMTRGNAWNLNFMFNPSMVLSSSNSVNVSVFKKNNPNPMNSSYITLNGTKILFLNKSDAASGKTIVFGYDSSRNLFYNTTFNPSSFGLTAGKYLLLLNASNISGNVIYSTTQTIPIYAFDFQVGLDLGGFTFGTGQKIYGKIFAYNTSANPPVGLNASSENVTVKAYDMTGAEVSVPTAASNVVDGQGLINITVPSTLGFYEIVVSVKTNGCLVNGCANNTVGVADNWVQVSNLNIETTTDRQGYQTTDPVVLSLKVSNSTSGSAMQGVSVEVVVDNGNTPALGTTGSDGKVTISLDPSRYAGSGSNTWSPGWHNLQIKISKNTESDVVKLDTWYGFDVRGFDLFLRPDRPVYQTSGNVTIDMYGALGTVTIPNNGVKVDGTTLTTCFDTTDPLNYGSCNNPSNGNTAMPGINYHVNDAWGEGSKKVELWNWTVGHHDVEITVSVGGGEQKFYTGFDVSDKNIIFSTDKFGYDLNENITLDVKILSLNGTALANQAVVATLYKAQPPNDINVTEASGTTNSTGQVTLKLNATKPGFNYIKINSGGQLQFAGVQVSSVKATLLNSTLNGLVTNYNAAPGDTVTIYVNATSGGANVPDGSTVTASLWAFGNRVDLPSNTTTSGYANISFQLPTFAPAQVYGLEVRLTTTNGEQGFAPQSSLTVTGGSAVQLAVSADRSFLNPYKPGDTATFTATVNYQNGAGASGYNVTFEVGSESSMPQSVGSAITGTGGSATKQFNITTNYTDGPYYLHAYITNSTDVQAYSGFLISTLAANLTAGQNAYGPGENITLSITLTNRTTGSQINATSGFLFTFNKEKGEMQQYISTSGLAQPYQVNVSVPNESSAVGTYSIGVVMFVNQSQGLGFTLVDVRNASRSLNLTLPSIIRAGTPFLANMSASTGATAELRVFSPAAEQSVYENSSITLSGTPANASINITINNAGVYVFNTFVSGIGTTTKIMFVSPSSTGAVQSVWTGTDTSTNSTTFTTSQSVYILSNVANSTASILTLDTSTNSTTSYSVPLTLNVSSTYYGIFSSSNLVSGRPYFVRLDTSAATGVASTMFGVS